MIGVTLGHYKITERIGAGGMGIVFKAQDLHLDRFVAIKVLPPEKVADPERKRRFVQEAKAASALNHPNIVTIHDIAREDGTDFIVMEYVEGKTLDQRIGRRGMCLNDALDYAVQIADALSKAHLAGIVHRDLKPSNIMVNQDGVIKILDFGLAKLAEHDKVDQSIDTASIDAGGKMLTEEGIIFGTLAYMSPEQAEGKKVDARSDIFSLGSVMYEMVTGQKAFQGSSRVSTFSAILHEQPKPASTGIQVIPPDLEHIFTKALEKDKDLRYQSAQELLADLKRLRRDLSSDTTLKSKRPLGANPRSRRRTGTSSLLALATILTALAIGVYWTYFGGSSHRAVESIAVLPFQSMDGNANTEWLCTSVTQDLIDNLSQISEPGLLVKSYITVAPFKGHQDFLKTGHELNVDAVLTATLEKQGRDLQFRVELTNVRTGAQIWGGRIPCAEADLGNMAENIAQNVTANLRLVLSAKDRERLKINGYYLSAQYQWNLRTDEGLKKAIRLYEDIIRLDPGYGAAYAGLANCYVLLNYYSGSAPGDSYPKARRVANEALRLDSNIAEAHAALGLIMRDYDRDWVGADREFSRAIELGPKLGTARQWYAEYLTYVGRFDEAIGEIRAAQNLSPHSLAIRAVQGWILLCAGRPEEAISQLQTTLDMNPQFALAHWFLGQSFASLGEYQRAAVELEKAIDASGGGSRIKADLACVYGLQGKRAQALAVLEEFDGLSRQGRYISQYERAVVYTGLGMFDKAFQALDKALEERSWHAVGLKVDPMLRPLRSDPRYATALLRLGMPAD
jgi:eukaryotic-like serine/threonine-protein kinase